MGSVPQASETSFAPGSMTGFGAGVAEHQGVRWSVRVQSVNHKGLELSLKLPECLEPYRLELMSDIKAVLTRGRVDVVVTMRGAEPEVLVDSSSARSTQKALRRLQEELELDGPLSLADVLTLSHAVSVAEPTSCGDEQLACVRVGLGQALTQLMEQRTSEGGRIVVPMRKCLAQLKDQVMKVSVEAADEPQRLFERHKAKIRDLIGEGADMERVAQEAATLASRSDVQEELDRLRSHCTALEQVLSHSGHVGLRIDFLCQELLREVNTLGSKLANAELRHMVVEMKLLTEQIREQGRNLE